MEVSHKSLSPGFFIPHFMVIRLDKTTTKYRLVMHGAMPFNGYSINDFLECGTNQVANLLHILLRLRRGEFVLTGDIEAMFMRIGMREEDCAALRIFFRASAAEPLKILDGRKHLFWLACSPFVAVMTMKHHAKANRHQWPVAFDVVMRDTMIDDFCVSAGSLDELMTVKNEMRELCQSMGMRIHKFSANHRMLLEDVADQDIARTLEIGDPEDKMSPNPELPNVKTLGMLWLPQEDVFCFQWEEVSQSTWTKREICSVAGRFFDPMGLASPLTILGKLIVQQL